jgi:ubiquinone/menaquinone biosynthesis C-methylase UbiE
MGSGIHAFLRLVKSFGLRCVRTINAVFRPRYYSNQWKNSKIIDHAENYEDTLGVRKNTYLQTVIKITPGGRVLEVGSYKGFRVMGLASSNQNAEFTGVEISKVNVAEAKRLAELRHLSNIEFLCQDISQSQALNLFKDRFFQSSFSFATLFYVHPLHIRKAVRELLRVSGEQVVIIEKTHLKSFFLGKLGTPVWGQGMWTRNYQELFLSLDKENRIQRIQVIDVPSDVWKPGGGGGAVCTVFSLTK